MWYSMIALYLMCTVISIKENRVACAVCDIEKTPQDHFGSLFLSPAEYTPIQYTYTIFMAE